jgi:hypothetical protein
VDPSPGQRGCADHRRPAATVRRGRRARRRRRTTPCPRAMSPQAAACSTDVGGVRWHPPRSVDLRHRPRRARGRPG